MPTRQTAFATTRQQRWMRIGSILICCVAIGFLVTALGTHLSSESWAPVLLTLALAALCVAIAMHVGNLFLVHREHRQTVNVLDATEQEYKSVFENALDGILILDDRAVCLEANAAAVTLFGTIHEKLVGEPIQQLFACAEDFNSSWGRFLDRGSEHRETRIVSGEGNTILVEYTAKARYSPGRHVVIVRDVTRRKLAEDALRQSEERFRQMAANMQEIFWMLDAENMAVLYVSPAYQTITGRTCESLKENPKSYEEVVHPEDRVRVLSRLSESIETGQLDEEFRIVRADKATRWVWVRGGAVRDSAGIVRRLVGTAQDVSARKSAEQEIARNLDMAEAARAEAEAFRKAGLALTQNLSMDYVLDTLLQSLLELIPCESAQVLLLEADTRLFLAREATNPNSDRTVPKFPSTLDAKDNEFLMHVLAARNGLLIANTAVEPEWPAFKGFSHVRSWMCVPLLASQQVLGLLSLGDARARVFTQEHLRLAKSLAIPAAVAIQNARLYERAEIFRAELEQRLADLEQT